MLFLTVRPKFVRHEKGRSQVGQYDPDKQVHAAYLLWYTQTVTPKSVRDYVWEQYAKLGHDLSEFASD